MNTLSIRDLAVSYRAGGRWLPAVSGFSLEIAKGQTVGLVGESGSGKTTVALAVMRYLGPVGQITGGSVRLGGEELTSIPSEAMRSFWGKRLALVPQNPQSALNPSIRIGEQLAETLRHHEHLGREAAAERAQELLASVRIPDPARVAGSYPHQISGGMQQRVMIAMALATSPELLILDEPTTNLDVTTQAAILDLFQELVKDRETATLYVTHNLGVVARVCDRVAVLYAGELVEEAATVDLFNTPLHPYTRGLIDSIPRPGMHKADAPLQAIPGRIPPLGERSAGCVFAARCPFAIEICEQRPPIESAGEGRRVRCHRWQEIAAGSLERPEPPATISADHVPETAAGPPLVRLDHTGVQFGVRRSLREVLMGKPARRVRAVDDLSLDIPRGLTLGLVGESGSGKTTLARAIVGLVVPAEGRIELLGAELPRELSSRSPGILQQLQYVFQNPEEALNPYLTVGETLSRPFVTLLGQSREAAAASVDRLLNAVQLPGAFADRLPGQLSGGEKQRVAIARAIASGPALVIADEAVSGLDVSVQASILNLLGDLQVEDTALLFISHDLAVVGYISDVIAVMYAGQLMEVAGSRSLFNPPYHPYTESLLAAIPVADPQVQQEALRLQGDPPGMLETPSGCPFHGRCPRSLGEICRTEAPPWQTAPDGQRIFCHIPLEELADSQVEVVR